MAIFSNPLQRMGMHQLFCVPDLKKERVPLQFYILLETVQNHPKLDQWNNPLELLLQYPFQNYSQSHHNGSFSQFHSVVPTLWELFLRHLSYHHMEAFHNDRYDNIIKVFNFKCNLVSHFCLKTWNSLLNNNENLNIQINYFSQSNS